MKQLSLLTLALFSCSAAVALPLYNPSTAGMMRDGLYCEGHYADASDPCANWCNTLSVRAGFYGDYVFDRHLEVDEDHHDADIDTTRISTNSALLSLNAWDRLDLFVTLGASSLFIDSNSKAFALGPGRFELETDTRFAWSVGVRGIVWQCGCTTIGGEAQYFSTRPHVSRLTQDETTSVYPDDFRSHYHEWQIGFGISQTIHTYIPYMGVKLARGLFKLDDRDVPGFTPSSATIFSLETKKDWGFVVGTSYVVCENSSVTVEGRFGDEGALFVSAEARF